MHRATFNLLVLLELRSAVSVNERRLSSESRQDPSTRQVICNAALKRNWQLYAVMSAWPRTLSTRSMLSLSHAPPNTAMLTCTSTVTHCVTPHRVRPEDRQLCTAWQRSAGLMKASAIQSSPAHRGNAVPNSIQGCPAGTSAFCTATVPKYGASRADSGCPATRSGRCTTQVQVPQCRQSTEAVWKGGQAATRFEYEVLQRPQVT